VPTPQNAIEFEDYLPRHEKITFAHSETEQVIRIKLVDNKVPEMVEKGDVEEGPEDEDDEEGDVTFKVKLEKPEPRGVKISKKNVCLVTITKGEDNLKEEDEKEKLIEYFLQQREPTWLG
jgi:hypothetical protein